MHTTTDVTAALPPEEHPAPATAPPATRYVPLERFFLRYTNREDPYKYEWNNGVVEKKARTMNRDQLFIVQNLLERFVQTQAFAQKGALLSEIDMFLPIVKRTRRADMAYLTAAQLKSARNGDASPCAFVIEIVSKNDQINELEGKIREYFDNGVQVLWVIFPQLKKVNVLHSVRALTVRLEDDLCSAAPVLDDFELTVREIFA